MLRPAWVCVCAQELGALNTTRSLISDIQTLGYTINLHNGDLAYAECVRRPCAQLEQPLWLATGV